MWINKFSVSSGINPSLRMKGRYVVYLRSRKTFDICKCTQAGKNTASAKDEAKYELL